VLVPGVRSTASLDWSPEARKLLFSVYWPDQGIYAIRIDGRGSARLIVPEPRGRHRQQSSAVWSPDGSRVAFARSVTLDEEVNYTLCVVDSDGGRPRRIYSTGLIDGEVSSNPAISWRPKSARGR
jgi:Tol biopolymer transport system component